jgi:hypothetical protein
MDINELLQTRSLAIVTRANRALSRAHLKSYEGAGAETTRLRLQALYNRLMRCVESRQASPMVKYVEDVAQSRFHRGVELFEIQTAFNALEEAAWTEMRATMTPSEFVDAVALLSTILGMGKDALARAYVSLAGARHVPAVDVAALSKGPATTLPVD